MSSLERPRATARPTGQARRPSWSAWTASPACRRRGSWPPAACRSSAWSPTAGTGAAGPAPASRWSRRRLPGEGSSTALLELGASTGDRGVLLPCTDAARRHASRGTAPARGRASCCRWPSTAVVEMLMDKVGFARHALERPAGPADRGARPVATPRRGWPTVPPTRAWSSRPSRPPTWLAHTSAKAFRSTTAGELLRVYDRVARLGPGAARPGVGGRPRDGPATPATPTSARAARPLVTFVARKLRQWPPEIGTSASARSAATTRCSTRPSACSAASASAGSPTWR